MKRYPSENGCWPGPPPGCCPPGCGGRCPAPVPFVPGGVYYAGQVVVWQDALYVVRVNDPQGLPGTSADFIPLPSPYDPWRGPTGPTGPTGPAGGPAGPTGATEAVFLRRGV